MIPEDIARFKKDFSKLKKKKLTKQDEDKLTTAITGLLGLFAIRRRKEVGKLIEEMISFGEKRNLAVQGSRVEFDRIKKGKFKAKV